MFKKLSPLPFYGQNYVYDVFKISRQIRIKRSKFNVRFQFRYTIFYSFSSREPMIKKEKSKHPETISNRFLMSKLVYRMVFDQFGTFSIFGLLFATFSIFLFFFFGKINSALGSKIWGGQNLSFVCIDYL